MDRGAWWAAVHGVAKSWTGLSKYKWSLGFPGGSYGKESTCNVGNLGSIPGWERSPGEGIATCGSIPTWRIAVDRRAWQAIVHGVSKSQT